MDPFERIAMLCYLEQWTVKAYQDQAKNTPFIFQKMNSILIANDEPEITQAEYDLLHTGIQRCNDMLMRIEYR